MDLGVCPIAQATTWNHHVGIPNIPIPYSEHFLQDTLLAFFLNKIAT